MRKEEETNQKKPDVFSKAPLPTIVGRVEKFERETASFSPPPDKVFNASCTPEEAPFKRHRAPLQMERGNFKAQAERSDDA